MLGFTRKGIALNFAIWSILALFTTTQLYLRGLHDGGDSGWWSYLPLQLLVWWFWGLITPVVFRMGSRFRIDRSNYWRAILIHLPAAVITVLFYLAFYTFFALTTASAPVTWESFSGLFQVLYLALFHWHFFIYMAVIGIAHARYFYIESRDRQLRELQLEKELIYNKLKFLKMQLQPHFLFNALNSIVSAVHQDKSKEAIEMVTGLSDLLRISLTQSEEQLIPLAHELEHIEAYLKIERQRFKKLEVSYAIGAGTKTMKVPNLILQPLVENAIKHGISKQADAQKIAISSKVEDECLVLGVYNEGPQNLLSHEGVGLSNVKNRLELHYDDHAYFSLTPFQLGVLSEIRIQHEN